MFNQETTKVSRYKRTTLTTPTSSVSIYEVYREIIGQGAEEENLGKLTEDLRSISEPDPQTEHDLKRDFKRDNFPCVSFGGEFSHRANKDLIRSSNLICLDFDHIGTTAQVEEMKQRISEETELDPVLLFISPSGDGLKVVVNVRQEIRNDEDFKGAFRSLRRFCQDRLNLAPDESCKDISRLCYLPHDENAILRQAGAGFDVEKWRPVEAPKPQVKTTSVRTPSTNEPDDFTRALIAVEDIERSGINITSDRQDWMRIGFALSNLGEEGRDLFHRVSSLDGRYNPTETDEQFDSFLRSSTEGKNRLSPLETLFKIASEKRVPMRSSNVYSQPRQEVRTGGQRVETGSPSVPPVQGVPEAPVKAGAGLGWLLNPTTETEMIERGKKRPPSLLTGYQVKDERGRPQTLRLLSGKLTEIAGATGHGKTLLLLNLLLNVSRLYPDKRFVLFTYEENDDTIIEYLLNIYLSDLNLMKAGETKTNRDLLDEYFTGQGTGSFDKSQADEFHKRKNIFFREYIDTGRILIKYIESDSTELCRFIEFLSAPENNIGGVFVDYFQYINPAQFDRKGKQQKFPTRQEALKSICIELKDIATETSLPVVLACQFNQEVLAPTDVLLNKIGEAGDISRIGSECWGLWQMGKDIGRELKGKDLAKVEELNRQSDTIKLADPFLKGMYLRVLKSRVVETGAEEMFKYRGLTGKIYPNETEGTILSSEDWENPKFQYKYEDDIPEELM